MELSYFALIGAPNCGKTVLFNGLTGSHAKVANYPGVTVDKREGAFLDDEAVRIIDLPGTYSLRTTSPDEAVAKDVMVGKMGIPPDAIIAVADATNLRMTLRMILELKTLGLPMVVSLNLSDVARKRGLNIDAAKLSELLDAPVLETVAVSASGVQAVREAVAKLPRKRSFPASPASAERTLDALDSDQLYREVESILAQVVRTQMTLPAWHKKLDDIVLHPVWGMILLLVILFMVFQAVYTWAAPIMDAIEGGFTALGEWVATNMEPGVLNDLIVKGVLAGMGSVLVFLPQITILFAFILPDRASHISPHSSIMIGTEIKEFGQVINNDKLMVVHVNLPQGKKIAPHDHQGQDIFFSIVKGLVKATLNNSEEHTLSPGTLLHFGGEAFIGIEALVDSEFFVYLINL